MIYFAYGSNLHPARLAARLSGPELVTTGCCRERRLEFRKIGRDGSAKCDAPMGPSAHGCVFGAVYELSPDDAATLDRIEGLGSGYDTTTELIQTPSGQIRALLYLASDDFVDSRLRPFEWYRTLVIAGARFHDFPQSYIAEIESTPTLRDPDRDRARRHLGVLPPEG